MLFTNQARLHIFYCKQAFGSENGEANSRSIWLTRQSSGALARSIVSTDERKKSREKLRRIFPKEGGAVATNIQASRSPDAMASSSMTVKDLPHRHAGSDISRFRDAA